ncbi:OsmC family protein [Sphingobacterium sp. JB170]|uniref:OsmC family protein n=1 Tax=Sphingobacterium sp. JB170 TaxID=1434842 RepID=UPI00097EC490|nr:OsmC family protein [Sphingobacterium sp. JB170]SJN47746.1 OsmC/Ohr family protein [Sphingobacterium sp. JB170]
MSLKHVFSAALQWPTPPASTSGDKSSKTHQVSIHGKQDLNISAAKAFKGDGSLYNPEDLLLTSLMSCHMMSYLYVCGKHNIEVFSYVDNATALLETYPDGSGKIIEVRLEPHTIISDSAHIDLALSFHEQANKLCFIANSCNFTIIHTPSCAAR